MIQLHRSGRIRSEDDVVSVGTLHMSAIGYGFQQRIGGVEQNREVGLICVRHLGVIDRNGAHVSVGR
jgi:hypothetical protein